MTTFQATGAYEAAQGLSDLFKILPTEWRRSRFRYKMGPNSIRNNRVTSRECPGMFVQYEVARVPINFKLCWLCTKQELNGDKVTPSYQRLRTMVRQRVDQTIRTRTFKARNERFETGVKNGSPRGASPSGLEGRNPVKIFWKESARNRRVTSGTLPCASISSLNLDASMLTVDISDTLKLMGSPVKKLPYWQRIFNWDVCPKVVFRKVYFAGGKLGSNRAVKFSKTTMATQQFGIEKDPSQGVMQKCVPRERLPWAPKFEERTQDETLKRERRARRDVGDLAKEVHKLKQEAQDTLYSPAEACVMPAPSSTKPEERRFVIDSGASVHVLSNKDPSSGELETLRRSRNLITVVSANGEVQTNEEAQVYVHDLHLFVAVQLLEDTPAVLSFGKLCEEHGYTYEWTSGQKPHLTKDGKNILCKTENHVPLVVPGLSLNTSTSSSSTSPTQDSSSK